MKRALSGTIALNFLHYLALYASRPYLSLLAGDLGGGMVEIGLTISLYSVVQVAAALPAGRWIAGRGVRRASLCGGALFLLGALLLAAASRLWMVGLASLWLGLGHSLTLLCGQHVVTGVRREGERARAVGWLSFFNSAGTFLGPMLGGALQDGLGRNRGFLGAAVLSVAAMGVAAALPGEKKKPEPEPPGTPGSPLEKSILRDVVMSGAVFFAADILPTYLPLYGARAGLTATGVGVILGVNGMAQMAVRPLLGPLCDRRPIRRVFRSCLLAGGACIACLGLTVRFWPLLAAAAAAGCAVGLANPLTLLTVSGNAGAERRGRALALRVMANYAGQTLSPILFGALAASAGLAAVFWCGGGALLLCGLGARQKE